MVCVCVRLPRSQAGFFSKDSVQLEKKRPGTEASVRCEGLLWGWGIEAYLES